MNQRVIPTISFGERFRVRSRSGKEYVVRFLHRGRGDSGVFVRTEGGHVARFDSRRVEWSTYEAEGDSGRTDLLAPGEEVLVDSDLGSIRGKLISQAGEPQIRLDNGLSLDVDKVHALHILFRAPSLMGGDRFWVRGRDGKDYTGDCLDSGPKTLRLRLLNGKQMTIPVGSLEYETLLVAVPMPRAVWAAEPEA